MNIEEVREYALSLPHTTERLPYGPDWLALEVGGKQFCLLNLSGEWEFYNLKIDPEQSLDLQDRYVGIRPGFHMNKKHWASIDYNGDLPDALQRQLILQAYQLILSKLPKSVRESLNTEE